MKKALLNLLLFLATVSFCKAQVYTLYFGSKKEITKKTEAQFMRLLNFEDSVTLQVRDFQISGQPIAVGFTQKYPETWHYKRTSRYVVYHPNGKIKESAFYKDDVLLGIRKTYFFNGKLFKTTFHFDKIDGETPMPEVRAVYDSIGIVLVKDGSGLSEEYNDEHFELIERGKYNKGVRDSVWTGCHLSGKRCYIEFYENGIFKKGIATDTLGKETEYREITVPASYKGGNAAFGTYLSNVMNYPQEAIREGVEGKVIVRFSIYTNGTVGEAYVLKSVSPLLDKEALRVVLKSSKNWIPGKIRGHNVKTGFFVPINFVMR